MTTNHAIFVFVLSLVFLLDGLGLPNGRVLTFYLILLSPLILFYKNFREKTPIYLPKNLSILFGIFFAVSAISTINSQNVQKSFEYLILYVSYFLAFIYTYNYKERLQKPLVGLIFIFSATFCAYSLLVKFMISNEFFTLLPQHGYQLVYSRFGSHNHLGDFLLVPIIIIFYSLFSRQIKTFFAAPSIISLGLFFILSFSRSAYLSLIFSLSLVVFFLKDKLFKKTALIQVLLLLFLTSSLLFFFLSARDTNIPTLSKINSALGEKSFLYNKQFLGKRPQIIKQAIESTKENPLLGTGPGNFYIASTKHTDRTPQTETAHNLFLDIFVENGALAGLISLAIAVLTIRGSKKSALSFAALAIFLNFQTDYTYRILSFFLLFMVLVGINYEEKVKIQAKNIVGVISIFLCLASTLILASNILLAANRPKAALLLYPLNEPAYVVQLETNTKLLNVYSRLFSGDAEALTNIASVYETKGELQNALIYYEKAKEKDPQKRAIQKKVNDLRITTNKF